MLLPAVRGTLRPEKMKDSLCVSRKSKIKIFSGYEKSSEACLKRPKTGFLGEVSRNFQTFFPEPSPSISMYISHWLSPGEIQKISSQKFRENFFEGFSGFVFISANVSGG